MFEAFSYKSAYVQSSSVSRVKQIAVADLKRLQPHFLFMFAPSHTSNSGCSCYTAAITVRCTILYGTVQYHRDGARTGGLQWTEACEQWAQFSVCAVVQTEHCACCGCSTALRHSPSSVCPPPPIIFFFPQAVMCLCVHGTSQLEPANYSAQLLRSVPLHAVAS